MFDEKVKSCFSKFVSVMTNVFLTPLDETHLVVVRGLIHQEVSPKVRQPGEVNRALQLKL